jgi:hypothetical protein
MSRQYGKRDRRAGAREKEKRRKAEARAEEGEGVAGRDGWGARTGEDREAEFHRLKGLIEAKEAEVKVEEDKTRIVEEDYDEKKERVASLKKEISRRKGAQEAARKKKEADVEMEKFFKVMPEVLSKMVKGQKSEELKLALKQEKIQRIQKSKVVQNVAKEDQEKAPILEVGEEGRPEGEGSLEEAAGGLLEES